MSNVGLPSRIIGINRDVNVQAETCNFFQTEHTMDRTFGPPFIDIFYLAVFERGDFHASSTVDSVVI
jgi:hypothetical protein